MTSTLGLPACRGQIFHSISTFKVDFIITISYSRKWGFEVFIQYFKTRKMEEIGFKFRPV